MITKVSNKSVTKLRYIEHIYYVLCDFISVKLWRKIVINNFHSFNFKIVFPENIFEKISKIYISCGDIFQTKIEYPTNTDLTNIS